MQFAYPPVLWLLAVTVVLLITFLWWAWRKKEILTSLFIQMRLLPQLTVNVSRRRDQARRVLLVGAVVFAFVALARPQWGFEWEEAKQRGLDIVVAIDTSRSMLASDLRPDRLTRAKLAALDLLKQTRSDRLGLVAFAGTAFLQCPLTLDDEAFRQNVEALDIGIIPQGGTALTAAIETALTAFKTEGDNFKTLVLFTDGEDHDSGALKTAERAAQAGLKIFTVGVGTPNGEVLQEANERGDTVNIKDADGNVVKSRLNEPLLQQMASATGGFYLPLRAANVIETLYEKGLAPLPKSDLASKLVRQFHDRYYWPLSLAILLLITELFLAQLRPPGRAPAVFSRGRRTATGALACLILLAAPRVDASSALAARLYQQGDYAEALKEYERLLEQGTEGMGPAESEPAINGIKESKDTEAEGSLGHVLEKRSEDGDPRLHFNAGAAAYKAGQFEDSIPHFARATTQPDLALQQRAFYNLGNALYRLGESRSDPNERIKHWEMAERSYGTAVGLDEKDQDARHNREFVKRQLEELKKQQQPQQPQPDQNQGQNQDQDNEQDQESPDQKGEDQEQQHSKAEEGEKERQQPPDAGQPEGEDQPQQAAQEQAGRSGQEEPEPTGDGQPEQVQPGQMTVQQAEQLLDAHKGEERALIFLPPQETNRARRPFKDW